jgi:hypothetical protein
MHKTTSLGLAGIAAALTVITGQWALTTPHDDRTVHPAALSAPDRSKTDRPESTAAHDRSETQRAPDERVLIGADVIMGGIHQINTYGPVGGIYAYIFSSQTCNIGDQHLEWDNYGTPTFAMNAYRLHKGRLVQIGLGWVKHACCVANSNNPAICMGMTCQGGPGGVLRVGCLDVYSASWNANQVYLGPRVGINPFSGALSSLPGGTGNAIFRRVQVHVSDMSPVTYPDALYFVESVYVATDDAQNENWYNNASYRRTTVNASYVMSLVDTIQPTVPAIYAWADYDSGAVITPVDVPDEGRFYVASKVIDNGNGTWRYEYAVYNLFSHRSGGSFSVPIASGANVTGIGFHAPLYHSGEQQDNTPWNVNIGPGAVTWTTAHSYLQNPNANAIRWGTMYNFWFTADRPPADAYATLDLFIPGTPGSVPAFVSAPAGLPCIGDLNGDDAVDVLDLLMLLDAWGGCTDCGACSADLNGDCIVDVLDLLMLLDNWGDCP